MEKLDEKSANNMPLLFGSPFSFRTPHGKGLFFPEVRKKMAIFLIMQLDSQDTGEGSSR